MDSPPPDPSATTLQLRMIAKIDRLERQVRALLSPCTFQADPDTLVVPSSMRLETAFAITRRLSRSCGRPWIAS